MAAQNTDLARKKKSNFSTTLNGSINAGDVTIPFNSASGLPTDTAITLTIDRVDANGVSTPTKRERVTVVISVNNGTNALRGRDSTTAQSHDSGAVVEDIWDASTWNDFVDAFLAQHTQAGAHSFSSVTLTTPKVVTSINDSNGNEVIRTPATASAVNDVTVTNAATAGKPKISATGDDTNIGLDIQAKGTGIVEILDGNGNEVLKAAPAVTSAVNEITIQNAATAGAPQIQATGGDTNIDIALVPKGAGKVKVNGSYRDITSDVDGATITLDLTTNFHKVTLGGNRTIALSNPTVGQVFYLRLLQDGTGSRTITWFTTITWAGSAAPTLTTTANKADLLCFVCTGSGTYDGFVVGQNIG